MKIYELNCEFDNRQSFYGKAQIREENGTKTLISYGVEILKVKGNKITPIWEGYSLTTQRHINEFMLQEFGKVCNKKSWEQIQKGEIVTAEQLF